MSPSSRRALAVLPLVLGLLAACAAPETATRSDAPLRDDPPTSVRALVEWLRAIGHAETMTFVQTTVFHRPDGRTDTTTWYEAMKPGRLRIDFAPLADGNGMLFRGGQQYVFRADTLAATHATYNPLLLTLSEQYLQPVDWTLAKLDSLGIDTAVLGDTTWRERPTYIVGARAGEMQRPQYWVDAADGYVVRVLTPMGTRWLDAVVAGHQRRTRGWTESEITIFVDGALFQEEFYRDVRTDVPLDDALFDPARWAEAGRYWE